MEPIIYEHPLNERIRTFLRLEYLFSQIKFFLRSETGYETRVTVSSLLDVLNIFTRSDLKAEVIKELDRHNLVLSRLQQSPGVDLSRLQDRKSTRLNSSHQ